MVSTKEELNRICQQAMQLLKEHSFTQVDVWKKLEEYDVYIGKTTAHKVLKGKGTDVEKLPLIAKVIQQMVKISLGMEWKDGTFMQTMEPGGLTKPEKNKSKPEYILHKNGRLPVADKVAFFQNAQQEVVEFGVKLNRFTHNLYYGGYNELKGPIAALLERGVHFKCYLIDAEHNFARLYFEDRETFQTGEKNFERDIKKNLEKLQAVQAEFAQAAYPGQFEIYTYNHMPYNYFLIIDGGTEQCKMMVSHYLYGIPRNQSPVLEFSKKENYALYLRYWDSYKALTKNAKRILPPLNA